jgi:hypothetical protein
MNSWQPIETAPKDGTCILVWDGSEINTAEWRCANDFEVVRHRFLSKTYGWYIPYSEQDEQGGAVDVQATHWMPLPEPPQE